MKYTIEQLKSMDWTKCKLEPIEGRDVSVYIEKNLPYGVEIWSDLLWYAHLHISGNWIFSVRVSDLTREGLTTLIGLTYEVDRFIERNLTEKKKVRVIHCMLVNGVYNVEFEVTGSVERVKCGSALSRPTIEELQHSEYDFSEAFYIIHDDRRVSAI